MDWSKGYTATYYMTLVDPITWKDTAKINITGGSIARSLDSLRESASIDCEVYDLGIEQWVRVYMDVEQMGANEHVALFTGLASSPNKNINGTMESYSLQCYSVLKVVDDIKLLRGWYAPMGMRGAEVIKDLLSVSSAPVDIDDDSPILTSNIIAEDDETRLTMIDKILTAMQSWQLRINGDGSIVVEPQDSTPAVVLDPLANDVIETQITIEEDWFSCPNVLLAINDDISAIARDDLDSSPVSTVNRGREVWVQESSCELADDESIEEYATRRLAELQGVQKIASYDRRFIPNVYPGDIIRLRYPEQELDGTFIIDSQTIDLAYSAKTSETVVTAY